MSTRAIAVILTLLCLAACASGPVSAPVAAGAAAVVAVLDQMFASGAMTPVQHLQLVQGVGALDAAVHAVQTAQAGTITTTEAATAAGGLAASVLGAVRLWRGPADKTPTRAA
jgi:predicted small lipoprotein YifL